MEEIFSEPIFREIYNELSNGSGNVIKAEKFEVVGKSKISVEEESDGGVKFVVKKDENDVVKEIKFICSCGESKSIVLDYSDE